MFLAPSLRPSLAQASTSKKIKLVNSIMSISPIKLMDGKKLKRYKKNLAKSLKYNRMNVEAGMRKVIKCPQSKIKQFQMSTYLLLRKN